MNVFAALLAALKGLTEAKGNIGQEDVRKAATTFIVVRMFIRNSEKFEARWIRLVDLSQNLLEF